MKIRLPRFKKKTKNPKAKGGVGRVVQQLFGFEKCDKGRYFKSSELNEQEIVIALVRLQTDLNWVKRILWIAIAGSGASHFLGG